MTLDDYLIGTKTLETEFAARVGISQAQVNRIRRGKSWPTRDLLVRIREITGGAVTADDFMPAASATQTGEVSAA